MFQNKSVSACIDIVFNSTYQNQLHQACSNLLHSQCQSFNENQYFILDCMDMTLEESLDVEKIASGQICEEYNTIQPGNSNINIDSVSASIEILNSTSTLAFETQSGFWSRIAMISIAFNVLFLLGTLFVVYYYQRYVLIFSK